MTRKPPIIVGRHGKSAMTRIVRRTFATFKAAVIGSFADLTEFVQLSGTPTVTGGKLTGNGAVRHVDQVGTDNYMVTAVVGATESLGICRVVTCATASFDRFYAVEVENNAWVSIVKGTGAVATTNYGIFGILLGLIGFFLGGFGISASLPKYGTMYQTFAASDQLSIWWDEPNTTIRVYKNQGLLISLVVPRWEIPHGEGSRYFGAMTDVGGYGYNGLQFSAIGATDV